MDTTLPVPTIREINQTGREIKKVGVRKWIINLLLASLRYLLAIVISIIVSQRFTSRQINNLSNKLEAKIDQKIDQKLTVNFNQGLPTEKLDTKSVLGDNDENVDSNSEEWIVDSGIKTDEGGYFCPNRQGFPYWSVWSTKKYSLEPGKLTIRFRLKDNTIGKKNNNRPPVLIFSFGDYKKGGSPNNYYRLNVFDGDSVTIRLYDSKSLPILEDRLLEEPNFESEMTLSIEPSIPDVKDNKLNINPELSYNSIDKTQKPILFSPDENFVVSIPSVDLRSIGVSKQIGIGTYTGDCLKVF